MYDRELDDIANAKHPQPQQVSTESDDSVPRHEAADIDWTAVYEQYKGRQ